MDHALVLQYIQALGYPICVSIALGWALWKVGGQLIDSHFRFVDTVKAQGDRAITILERIEKRVSDWPSDLADICRASGEQSCETNTHKKTR